MAVVVSVREELDPRKLIKTGAADGCGGKEEEGGRRRQRRSIPR